MGAAGGSASAPGPSAAADDALDILREGASPSRPPIPPRAAARTPRPRRTRVRRALGDPARHSAPESDPAAYSSDDDDDDDRADRRRDNKRRERPTPSPSPDPSPDRRRARAAPPRARGPGPGTRRTPRDDARERRSAAAAPAASVSARPAEPPEEHPRAVRVPPGTPPPRPGRPPAVRSPPGTSRPCPPAPFGRRADPDPGRRPSFDRQPERPGVDPPRGSSRDRASYPPRGADHHREHHHRAGGPDRPRGIGIAPHPHQRHHQIQTHPIGVGPDRDAPSDSGTTADPRDLPARFEDAATIFLTRSQLVSLVDALGADASAAQRAEALRRRAGRWCARASAAAASPSPSSLAARLMGAPKTNPTPTRTTRVARTKKPPPQARSSL